MPLRIFVFRSFDTVMMHHSNRELSLPKLNRFQLESYKINLVVCRLMLFLTYILHVFCERTWWCSWISKRWNNIFKELNNNFNDALCAISPIVVYNILKLLWQFLPSVSLWALSGVEGFKGFAGVLYEHVLMWIYDHSFCRKQKRRLESFMNEKNTWRHIKDEYDNM